MFFQISPVVHKKPKKIVEEKPKEEPPEILSLAPFTPTPKIAFENVIIGREEKKQLIILNPTNQNIQLFIKKNVPEDVNMVLNWTETTVEKSSQAILEMIWCPQTEESCRHIISLTDGKRINRDVPVSFKAISAKPKKTTGAKPKTSKTDPKRKKSPPKLPLVKKSVSPTKKFKPLPKGKSPKRFSPSHHPKKYGKFNDDDENKENKTNGSFRSPTSVTFTLEKSSLYQGRDTYILQPVERRETFTLKSNNYLEIPQQHRGSKNDVTLDTSTFSDSLEMISPKIHENTRYDFEYKLKVMESFTFSPLNTTAQSDVFLPEVYSTASKPCSTENSRENTPLTIHELFPPGTNRTFELKGNLTGDTFTRSPNYDGNTSGGTYVKDTSVGDAAFVEISPLSSRTTKNPSPVFLKPKSFDFSFKNEADFRKQLSSIAEESGIISECETSMKLGSKRKINRTFCGTSPKRRNEEKRWSKESHRTSKTTTTSGLNLQQFHNKTNDTKTVSISETRTKTVIITNPFLYANIIDPFMTAQIYSDEEWIQQQENNFTKWLNALLTPPIELDSEIEGVDVAKVWQECKKREVQAAPSKEHLSNKYNTNSKLDNLRRHAQNLFRSKEMSQVLQKVCLCVESGKLNIRDDKDLHLNLKLKSDVMAIILSYNPLWLRIGLETVFNETIPLKSNSDVSGLINFILERLFKDPYLLKKHKTVYAPKYTIELKKSFLKKFLTLVYFLDQAKNQKLIPHDPCLFCKKAIDKESKEILLHFSRETLQAVGDITKYLRCLGYTVTHKQLFIHEYNYAVTNLGADLRDGVRLARVMEIIQLRQDLIPKMRVPAISRLQKVHNMEVAFKSLHEYGYELQSEISPKDLVDGHREKTLSFLWQIIYKFEAPLMVKSATTVQVWFRSLPVVLKRRKLQRIYKQKRDAANKIKNWYKRQKRANIYDYLATFVKEFVRKRKMEKSAVKIQAYYRMYTLRQRYVKLRILIEKIQIHAKGWLVRNHYSRRIKSAIVIQKNYRRYIARKRFLNLKQASIIIQTHFRAFNLMKIQKLQYETLRKATIIIQRRFRANESMKIQKNTYKKLKESCITIQKYFRGAKARKHFLLLRKTVVTIQNKFRAKIAMKHDKKYYETLKKTVLYIQRKYRGNLLMKIQRKQYLKQKQSAMLIQNYYRMYSARKRFTHMKKYACVLQKRYRAKKSMENHRYTYLQLKKCTIFVQRTFRANKIAKKQRNEFLLLKKSTTFVQQTYRANKARKIRREIYVKIKTAAIKIQTWYKSILLMRTCRNNYQNLKKSVLIIEQKYHAIKMKKIHQKNYIELKQATVLIQQRYRALKQMENCKNNFARLKTAAIIIQRRYKAKKHMELAKENYTRLKQTVITIQNKFRANKRMKLERNGFLTKKQAVIKLQIWYRATVLMRQHRTYYVSLKYAVGMFEERYLARKMMLRQSLNYKTLRNATLIIQTRYRALVEMRKQRENYVKLRNTTILIQTRFRANKLSKIEHDKYLTLKSATTVLQRRFRAQVAMLKAREHFINMKFAALTIQQRYRANIAMKIAHKEYQSLRNSTILIQQRYRAQKLMINNRNYFVVLKEKTIFVQQKFRANQQAKIDRKSYLNLVSAAIIIQRRFRAKKSMQIQNKSYLTLKHATVSIQRRFRANNQMKIARNEFLMIKNAAITIQRRYRAKTAMRIAYKHYNSLKSSVIFIQRLYRANRVAKIHRNYFLRLKHATIVIQRRYRAKKDMLTQNNNYNRVKWAVLVIQQRYRAQMAMKTEMRKYAQLRHATYIIQRRFVAWRLMKEQRKWYLQFKSSVTTIQGFYRRYLMTKNEHELFLAKRSAIIDIQRLARGYVVRKKYAPMLTVEAIQKRKIVKVENAAACKIQAIWRGYYVRNNADIEELKMLRRRKATMNVLPRPVQSKTLGQRCEMAMQCMINENSSLLQVIRALEDLDFITRHCRDSCIRMSHILPDQLYIILSAAARSLPEMTACNLASLILINFCKYPPTKPNSWVPEYVESLLNIMLHWCDKEEPLFSTLCTLLWLFAHQTEWKQFILALPNISQRLLKIERLIHRKQTMAGKVRGKGSTYFAAVSNLPLPSQTANWGLDYDRPTRFTNAVYGFNCLRKILNL